MIRLFKLLPCFLLGILFLGTVHAQNNRAALIIGIEHYRNPVTAPSLLGVPADMNSAKQIAKAMGIPDKNVTVIQNQQATKRNLMEAFKKVSEFGANGGRVLSTSLGMDRVTMITKRSNAMRVYFPMMRN